MKNDGRNLQSELADSQKLQEYVIGWIGQTPDVRRKGRQLGR
jgi:hypothetical protein